MTSKLLLIDGHSLAFRAFYALRDADFTTTTGEPVGAVYGFVSMLAAQLRKHQPTHVAAAFDASRRSFRTEIYPEYKGGRAETPEEFKGQVPLIQEVLAAIGIRSFTEPEVEADDVVATLATRASRAGLEVLVMSGDRDTFQLVSESVTVLYPQGRGSQSEMAEITPAEVKSRYGVTPAQYPDLAALVGEHSDNLPGVPKVGKVTAAKWINQYGSLDQIIGQAGEIGGVVGESLRQHLDQVRLNRQLGELRRDVGVAADPEDLELGPVNRQELDLLFTSLQFGRIKERLLDSGVWGANSAREPLKATLESIEPVVIGVGGMAAFLDEYRGQTAGLEVSGRLAPGGGEAWSIMVGFGDGRATAIDASSIDPRDASALADWLKDSLAAKAVHGAKTVIQELHGSGFELNGVVFDTELAAYLIWPDQRGYDLAGLTERFLGERLAEEERGGQGILDLGDGPAGLERAARAVATARLVEPLSKELEDRQGTSLLVELEQPLTVVLARMERAGVAVDLARLNDVRRELAGRVEMAEHDAFTALGGKRVNLASTKALQEVLFTDLAMPKTRRTKTGYSTDAESLAELFKETSHPFLEHLLAHRDAIKLRQMVDSLLGSVQDDARIHTTFGQVVAATGRLSSSDPNLQNIPARSQIGRQIRHCFVVGPGYAELISADYSQIEMRIMAHLSGDQALIAAFNEGEDLHRTVAAQVFGTSPDKVTAEQRSRIKAMSYGLAYGLSAYGLSRQLGIRQSEAEALRNDYFDRFGGIRDYLDGVVAQARRDGYTQTILGRRRYLPDLGSTNRQRREMAERMALNAPIQGSAADIIKVAMLKAEAALRQEDLKSRLILQVHDELIVEAAAGDSQTVADMLRREMAAAAQLDVPLTVLIGRGESWREAGH
ncbi:MAG: DNA polymerase I [Bifidobacteriaceae bacterium]|jgi:DNA polymerase-1|nr:DNA polymerase I [Bifidobacteriaceae bacterium]